MAKPARALRADLVDAVVLEVYGLVRDQGWLADRALEVVPPVTCQLDQGAYLFAGSRPREVRLAVRSTRAPLAGRARLRLVPGPAEPRGGFRPRQGP